MLLFRLFAIEENLGRLLCGFDKTFGAFKAKECLVQRLSARGTNLAKNSR
jgi:hypothetical protein